MPRFAPRLCVLLLAVGLPTSAATLSGSFSYDGQPVSSVFPGYTHGFAAAISTTGSQWTYGTVDLVTGTYQIGDLDEATYFVRVLVGPEDFDGRLQVHSGELTGFDYVEVGSDPQATLDLALGFAYRITQPYSGLWPGSVTECPYGPATADGFTFAWEPVPRAVSYRVRVQRWRCEELLETTVIEAAGNSVDVVQGVATGEEFVSLRLIAESSGGADLARPPYIEYDNGRSEGAFVHRDGGGGSGRTIHPASSVFVPQVARAPGVGASFWTTDLIVTNPTSSAVTATLIFTERGANGLDDYLEETVAVPAGGSRVIEDVVGELFGITGAGSLEVSPASLLVTTRIATPGLESGSYGQGFPALPSDAAASRTGPVTTLGSGGVARGAFRTNLILTEVWGESATVEVSVRDRDGSVLGTTTVGLPPFGTQQLNDVVNRVGGPTVLEEGQVTVEVTSGQGRVISALSLVDQGTSDPTTLELQPLP